MPRTLSAIFPRRSASSAGDSALSMEYERDSRDMLIELPDVDLLRSPPFVAVRLLTLVANV